MSIRGKIVAALIRPNKLLYRWIRPSALFVRRYVHPQSWLGGKLCSPFGVTITRRNYAGIPGAEFLPKKHLNIKSIIVFLHGGGYCFGSSLTTHRLGVALMAKYTRITCHSIDYRLAPEHPFPAALEDALLAWTEIVKSYPNCRLILSGDSAGGGLALALMMRIRDEGGRLPDDAILFSPWTDLTCRGETYTTKARKDPMFSPSMPRDCSDYYAPEGVDKTNPLISPAYGDLTGLPRMLILCGGNEILLSDSQDIALKAKQAGLEVELALWENMFHDWWLFGRFIPETSECLTKISTWLE